MVVGFLPLALWGIWWIVDAFLIPGIVRDHLQQKRLEMIAQVSVAAKA